MWFLNGFSSHFTPVQSPRHRVCHMHSIKVARATFRAKACHAIPSHASRSHQSQRELEKNCEIVVFLQCHMFPYCFHNVFLLISIVIHLYNSNLQIYFVLKCFDFWVRKRENSFSFLWSLGKFCHIPMASGCCGWALQQTALHRPQQLCRVGRLHVGRGIIELN